MLGDKVMLGDKGDLLGFGVGSDLEEEGEFVVFECYKRR